MRTYEDLIRELGTKADVEQGSDEWRFMRLGVASASKAKEFLSGRDTATYQTYLCEKVAEIATGMLSEQINSKALSWGKDNEDTARAAYEFETGHIIKQIPFIYRDESKYFGCSPDGITDDAHGLELKCPFSSTVFVQFKCNDKIKKEYELQCQFSMWVSGRESWDFANYDPRMRSNPLHFVTIERDNKIMEQFDRRADEWIADMSRMLSMLGVSYGDQFKYGDY